MQSLRYVQARRDHQAIIIACVRAERLIFGWGVFAFTEGAAGNRLFFLGQIRYTDLAPGIKSSYIL
jgi:hypothetical protein